MENYLRDLSCRQNRPVTQAELHLYLNAKRYYNKDLEEYIRMAKDKKQIDFDGKEVENLNIINDDIFKEYDKRLEQKFIEKYFVYKNKVAIVDDEKHMLNIRYKSDLFDEFIIEFKKLYEWLDSRASYLKFNDEEGNDIIINKTEIETVIEFLNKLNKIK